jgi:raffinose/stachyose/melibiose transport system permease protein
MFKNPLRRWCWLFLGPVIVAFIIGFVWPFFQGIWLSLCKFKLIRDAKFIGFGNYAAAFADESFRHAFWYTALFAVVSLVLINVLAFTVAYLLTQGLKGSNLFRTVFFMPNLIGGIVLGYVWQFVFNNVLLSLTANLFNIRSSILSDTPTAFMAIIIVYIWQYAGYIMLIYINGLVTIPGDVIEAANIDGASPLATLFQIKIPMIMSTITICTFLPLTSAFKQFDVNMALTNGTGSVQFMGNYLTNGTQMLALNIYSTAIAKNSYALGQAKAVLFFVILATVSLIQVRITNSKEVEM